jgi:AcrR family transcriptional regulator
MSLVLPVEPRSTRSAHVREKRMRRRAEIVQAALHAFREKGYHQTTLGDIADKLGVRKTALYHYFPDKESILYHCHRESLNEVSGFLETARELYDSAADQLRYVIQEHVKVMTDTLEGSPVSFEVPSLTGERLEEIVRARDLYERGLRAIIEKGIQSGEFQPMDAKLAVFAILGAINWISRWFHPGGAIRTTDMGIQFADHLVGGLTNGKQR